MNDDLDAMVDAAVERFRIDLERDPVLRARKAEYTLAAIRAALASTDELRASAPEILLAIRFLLREPE